MAEQSLEIVSHETCGGCRFGLRNTAGLPALTCIGAPPGVIAVGMKPAAEIQLTKGSKFQAPAQLDCRTVEPQGIVPSFPACALWHCRYCNASLFEDCRRPAAPVQLPCPKLPPVNGAVS